MRGREGALHSSRTRIKKFESEIRFIGMRRGGQHGVINWLRAQEPLCDSLCYRNNVKIDPTLKRPFTRVVMQMVDSECKHLFHAYEDLDLSLLLDRDLIGGRAKRFNYVLLLRDPFNMVASLINWHDEGTPTLTAKNMGRPIGIWKQHAREYLGQTRILPRRVVISFNRWFVNREYRRQFSDALGLKFSDAALNQVSHQGYGSSFGGQLLDGNAQQMKVLERYREVVDNPLYQTVCEDKELCELSHAIFGNVRS